MPSKWEERIEVTAWVLFILAALLVMFSGCKTVRYVPVEVTTTETVIKHDSIIEVRLVEHTDTVTLLKGDTISYLSNEYVYSWASVSGGILSHSLGTIQGAKVDTVIQYIEREKKIEVPVVVEKEKSLSLRERALILMGKLSALSIFVIIVLIGIIIWIRRKGGTKKD